jgi:glycosyltransferase involved in cell wall biosynthesis
MTVDLELVGVTGCGLPFAPARDLFECGMNIHAELSHARSIFAPAIFERLARRCCRGHDAGMSRPEIVCLLPAHNEEAQLPGYLESARSVCDAIVALDDGSTDATADMLQASPLVRRVISRPPRHGYRGWHDGHNRNLLLRAADEFEPRWVLWLDADERIAADDARVLREFVTADGLPGCAYGLQHYRMWGTDRFVPEMMWVFRLFAWRPGLELPDEPLHLNPVPTAIHPGAWLRTTIRLKHFGSATEEAVARRMAKYREADPDGRYPVEFGGLTHVPTRELPRWEARPARLPVLWGSAATHQAGSADPRREDGGGRVVALLPARNCAADLPGCLDSLRAVADAVVALDDGSTDQTRAVLEADPLVALVLQNPRREGYAGWDDAANRNRLLDAAAGLHPDWILQLDADERVDGPDAAALRSFLERDAVRGLAYAFRWCRMIDDGEHYDQESIFAARVFAYEPGQRFPDTRLHLVPIPTSIPSDRIVHTSLRIQHLAGLTESRRRERWEKYREADPANEFQASYENILEPPAGLKRWRPRHEDVPVVEPQLLAWHERRLVAADERARRGADLDLEGPVISAVIISRDDETRIERTVRSVVGQRCSQPFEVIVVTSGSDRTAEVVRAAFPGVSLIELPRPALPGEARNAGLRVARGDYVTFPGSHTELPQGSLEARLAAHEAGYAMVSATMLNGTTTRAGWASYFVDHSGSLPCRPSGPIAGPPAQCSYHREHLELVGGFPEDMRAGEDTVVNRELYARGLSAYRAQAATVIHHTLCRTPWRLLRHHFVRGRALGRILLGDLAASGRPFGPRRGDHHWLRGYPRWRRRQTAAEVAAWGGELSRRYRQVRLLVAATHWAAYAGCWYELLRPGGSKLRLLRGRGAPSGAAGPASDEPLPRTPEPRLLSPREEELEPTGLS